MHNELFAQVILPLPVGDLFTYRIPAAFEPNIKVGVRVVVQFGARKFYSALVYKITSEKPVGDFQIKDIDAVLDKEPIVNEAQFILWEWIAEYYCCTIGEVYKAALPSALKLESQAKVSFNPNFEIPSGLEGEEEALLLMLQGHGQTSIQEVNRFLGKNSSLSTLKLLLEKNAIILEEKLAENYRPKTASFVSLVAGIESRLEATFEQIKRAKKQVALLEYFLSETIHHPEQRKHISKADLLKKGEFSEAVLSGLVKKGILQVEQIEIRRLDQEPSTEIRRNELNPAQKEALSQIKDGLKTDRPLLLHGVTSSGKTEVYIKLIEEQVAMGNQVLYLVPEIGLTTQLINRLKKVFGNKAGVYHSKFNDAERVEIWMNILNQQEDAYQLVVGARSAAFLPFKKLGLIIVDEEHESSYKQFDPAPRYNARDVAVVLAQIHKAGVLLGTATPSFESYLNAKTGKYNLVELKERYLGIEPPEMIVADVRKATRQRSMKSLLTPELFDQIEMALANNEQVILFQNRRGFAPYLQCNSCGWIPKCNNCDVSLTYHKYRSALICHYCGHTSSLPSNCGECHSEELKTKGFGTEKIEEELSLLFPSAKIARMDLDTTRAKKAYERIIYQFESGNVDMLIGTQMVTKGLDFDNVRVVGVLDADQLLNYPDFRSFERSYQLMAQVSGRAGRKNKQGTVVLQTHQPEHTVIKKLVEDDFVGFFNQQMLDRKMFKYPPYYRLIKIVLKHKNKDRLDLAASNLATGLRKKFGFNLLGPEYPVVGRIQNWFQKEIWIKLAKNQHVSDAKKEIQANIAHLKSSANNSNLNIYMDVDPF